MSKWLQNLNPKTFIENPMSRFCCPGPSEGKKSNPCQCTDPTLGSCGNSAYICVVRDGTKAKLNPKNDKKVYLNAVKAYGNTLSKPTLTFP